MAELKSTTVYGNLTVTGSFSANIIPRIETGSGTFNTTPDTATTISHSQGTTDFRVMITPTSDPGGFLGEYWVTKTTTNFSVYKTGSGASITFDYILIAD